MNRDSLDMIKALVNQVGDSAEQIISDGLGLEKKGNNYKCPNFHEHKNGDKNPSMGWVKGKNYFNCLRCGENIDIYTYYTKYMNYTFSDVMAEGGIQNIGENRKAFKKNLDSEKSKLTEEQKKFIADRDITNETRKYFKLFNSGGSIGIPYLKNQILTGVKKRNISGDGIKNTSITGSKYALFNQDSVEFDKPLVITEGEWDAMIVHQSGYTNVVSVGCGANSVKSLFEITKDFLNKFDSIILFTDNDDAGNSMDSKFLLEFEGKVATVDKTIYQNCKDANEIYLTHGKEKIKKVIDSGKVSFDGEWDLDNDPYTELDPKDTKFIRTGIEKIDYSINTIQSRTVTLITGRSNAGKSTFVNQVLLNGIENGFKTYLVAGEGEKMKIANRFYTSMIGYDKKYYDEKKFGIRKIKEPKQTVLEAIQRWHEGKFKMFIKSLSKYKTEEQLFRMLEYKIRTEGYSLIILDNLMSLLTVSRSQDKNEAQGQFIERCHHLAKSCNCAIIVVLHPNKTYKGGEEMEFEQISGTSDIANKADVILNVIRIKDPADGVTSKIQIAKNRDWSELPTVECAFVPETNSYAEIVNGQILNKPVKSWIKYLKDDVDKTTLKRIEGKKGDAPPW